MKYRCTKVYRGALVLNCLLFLFTTTASSQDTTNAGNPVPPAGSFPVKLLRKLPALPPGSATSVVPQDAVEMLPYATTGQMLSGRASGADVRFTTGEPGVPSLTLIRGTAILLNNNRKMDFAQPLYVIDGIPLVMDHPYTYDIKRYDIDRPGPNTDITALVDMNNIVAIEVLKDAAAAALYGPRAVNGVIRITTRQPFAGKRKVSVNSYAGLSVKPSVSTINAAFEKDFRMPFYNLYGDRDKRAGFPRYLSDSAQAAYYGAADWDDLYYRNAFVNGFGASIAGGGERANFIFGIGQQKEGGVADKTGINKYDIYFKLNIEPVKNLHILTSISGALADRKRGSSLRERFSEEEYLPALTDPLPPNKTFLSTYYSEYDRVVNKGKSNNIQASVALDFDFLKHWKLTSFAAIDYNDQNRDFFIPGSINEGNSYISYFTGLNRRVLAENALSYSGKWKNKHALTFKLGQSVQYDYRKYDYTKGYRGPSDFIKIIRAGDKETPANNTFDQRLVYSYKDYIRHNLVSFYGNVNYDLADRLSVQLSLRSDGSSNLFQSGYIWAVSPIASAVWRLAGVPLLRPLTFLDKLDLRASYGRTGRLFLDNNNGYGAYYTVDAGWNGSQNISSYGGQPSLGLPYTKGYTGWGTRWPYTEHINLGADVSLLKNLLNISVDVYSKTDKDMMLGIPVPTESGFSLQQKNGMSIRNYGVELTLGANITSGNFRYQPVLIIQTNQNKLKALPDGLQDIVYEGRRLLVGKPVDRFWMLQNTGIFNTDDQVPVNPATGKKLSYNGIPFKAGDPVWTDQNGDYLINDQDRIMKGHLNPGVFGGFSNTFSYRNISLSFLLVYALDRQVINARMAHRFDFVNREGTDHMDAVKELTYWTKEGDYARYPIYNPWSFVNPYQADQSLFVENGSYAKLRSLTLSYDLAEMPWAKKNHFSRCRVYLTGGNLFTITGYTGADPEFTDYRGYDNGYAMPVPKTYTIGFNLDF